MLLNLEITEFELFVAFSKKDRNLFYFQIKNSNKQQKATKHKINNKMK